MRVSRRRVALLATAGAILGSFSAGSFATAGAAHPSLLAVPAVSAGRSRTHVPLNQAPFAVPTTSGLSESGGTGPVTPGVAPGRGGGSGPSGIAPATITAGSSTPPGTAAGSPSAPAGAPGPSAGTGGAGNTTATTTRQDQAPGYSGKWGVYVPDFPGRATTLDRLQSELGRRSDFVMWYVHWSGPYSGLDLSDFRAVAANGSTPVVTWMSDDPTGAGTVTDAAIASGRYDAYIRTWANGLRSYGRTVLLRFDHEMNGDWYGWSPGVNGNTAAGYVAAWRHVHDLFSEAGATNVVFVWSPNVDYRGAVPLASLYPGDAYVGMVAVDGYNWGTLDGHTWQTPEQVFGPTLEELSALTAKPQMIGEVGCAPGGGDKAAWITSFFSLLSSDRAITGFLWFDADKETDWRIDSSSGTLASFRVGLVG